MNNHIERLAKTAMGRKILKALRYMFTHDESDMSRDSVINTLSERDVFDYYMAFYGVGDYSGMTLEAIKTIYEVEIVRNVG